MPGYRPDPAIGAPDYLHPSVYGAYLSGLVLFQQITGTDARTFGQSEAAAAALGLPVAVTLELQQVASEAVAEENPAPFNPTVDPCTLTDSGSVATTYNFGTLADPGSCMDAQGAGTADGTQIQEWTCNGTVAQSFAMLSQGDNVVTLYNPNADKCVDVANAGTDDGTQIRLWDCNGTDIEAGRTEEHRVATARPGRSLPPRPSAACIQG
jgi:hypothetical protein